jgi:hypothetical protein
VFLFINCIILKASPISNNPGYPYKNQTTLHSQNISKLSILHSFKARSLGGQEKVLLNAPLQASGKHIIKNFALLFFL